MKKTVSRNTPTHHLLQALLMATALNLTSQRTREVHITLGRRRQHDRGATAAAAATQ